MLYMNICSNFFSFKISWALCFERPSFISAQCLCDYMPLFEYSSSIMGTNASCINIGISLSMNLLPEIAPSDITFINEFQFHDWQVIAFTMYIQITKQNAITFRSYNNLLSIYIYIYIYLTAYTIHVMISHYKHMIITNSMKLCRAYKSLFFFVLLGNIKFAYTEIKLKRCLGSDA